MLTRAGDGFCAVLGARVAGRSVVITWDRFGSMCPPDGSGYGYGERGEGRLGQKCNVLVVLYTYMPGDTQSIYWREMRHAYPEASDQHIDVSRFSHYGNIELQR